MRRLRRLGCRVAIGHDAPLDPETVYYYHRIFTLPAPISDIAYYNKSVVYGLLFQAAAETLLTIAADPKHLGARIGLTMVLHTWGGALRRHPHLHVILHTSLSGVFNKSMIEKVGANDFLPKWEPDTLAMMVQEHLRQHAEERRYKD